MSTHPDRIRSIFNEVVDLQPTERAAALGRLCGDDNSLRAELDALLASHDAAHVGGFMTSPTAATTVRSAAITEAPGSRVGPYKLLQVIGEGGFGTVFLAEQSEPVRRRVALKIIKLGMDTKQVIARFEAERQALALMDHPHIARVLDAGATPITEHGGGRPYFVMEYVVGDAITQFAANNNLDIRARLELFAQVCSAVQHAHTKGIIHRDIKPGNVLVTMTDGKPFARVIDFGIAKATSSAAGLTDKTLFTEHRQLIGTPEYMSPEQAQGSPDIDTRTDVYALGVLLYELLAGDTPFDGKRLRSAAWDEMRRIIKEEDPPTPSARVTQRMKVSGSASSPSAPLARVGGCPSVPSDLRGELDWIVMKSLDKDRARRYETPSALAADVLRHLKGEAVQAAPPSAAYRLRKFVRRNKGPVIVGSTVVIAILAGTAIAFVGWREASALARAKQQDQERAAAKVAATFSQIFNTDVPWHMKPQPGLWMSVTTSLDRETRITRAMTPDGPAKVTSVTRDGKEEVPPLSDSLDALSYVSELAISGFNESNKALQGSNERLRAQTDAAEWSAYTANLALAQAAMDAGNWPEARERLRECPESKRGWEWTHLSHRAQPVRMVIRGTGDNDDSAWVSPDGRFVVVPSRNGLATLSELKGDQLDPLLTRPIDCSQLVDVALSEDRSLLATISGCNVVIDDLTQEIEPRLIAASPRSGCDYAVEFSPDGQIVAVGSNRENNLALYRVSDGSFVGGAESGYSVLDVDFSNDGQLLLSGSTDGIARLYRVTESGPELLANLMPDDLRHELASGVTFNHDGTHALVTSGWNPVARIWDLTASPPRVVSTLRGHTWNVAAGAFSPDGELIVTASFDGTARIWSVDGACIGSIPMPDSRNTDLDNSILKCGVTADGQSAVVTFNESIMILDLASLTVGHATLDPLLGDALVDLRVAALLNIDPSSLAARREKEVFLPKASRRFVATPDRSVKVFDTVSGREIASLQLEDQVLDIGATPDESSVVVRLTNGTAHVWSTLSADAQRQQSHQHAAERVPAGAYLDTLLAGPTPTNELENAVIGDASLTPLRRLVAAEMLKERLAEINWAADRALATIAKDQTDKAAVLAAAAALQPSDALPPRAIEMVIAQANDWEYIPSAPSTEDRLAEAERVVELTREQLQTKVVQLEEAGALLQKQTDAAKWSAYTANIFAALSDPYAARRYLDACDENLRNWEWRYLRAESDASMFVLRAPGGERAYWRQVKFAAGGERVIALADTGQVLSLLASTGEIVSTSQESVEIIDIQASAAGDVVAVLERLTDPATGDKSLRYEAWDARTLQRRFALPGQGTVSPAGDAIYAAGRVLRAADGATITTIDSKSRYRHHNTQFASNGTDIVTWGFYTDGEANYRIDLWDGKTGERLGTADGLPNIIELFVAGDVLLTTHHDDTYRTWDAATLAPIGSFEAGPWTLGAAVSPDGKHVLSRPYDETARVYEIATGALVQEFTDESFGVNGGVFSPDGSRIVARSGPFVCIWDVQSGRRLAKLAGHGEAWINMAYSPDGATIVSHAYDGTLRLWDASTTPVSSFEAPDDPVYRSGWGSARDSLFNGTHVLAPSSNSEPTIALMNADTGKAAASWRVPAPEAWDGPVGFDGAFFSPDGKRVFTRRGSSVRAWEASTAAPLGEIVVPVHIDNPNIDGNVAHLRHGHAPVRRPVSLACDDAGRRLLACLGNGLAQVYDVESGRVLIEVKGEGYPCGSLSPDGSLVAIAWASHAIHLYDVQSGRLLKSLEGHTNTVLQVAFDPSGRLLATRADDYTYRLWNIEAGTHRVLAEVDEESRQDWALHNMGTFDRDGSRLTLHLNARCAIMDTKTGERLSELNGHAWWIDHSTFSPNGSRVFTSSGDNTIRVWETATGREVMTLRPEVSHEDGFDMLQLSPDGSRLIARYAYDPTIHVFDTVPYRERRQPAR